MTERTTRPPAGARVDYRAPLETALAHALAHLAELDELPAVASTPREELLHRLDGPLPERGRAPSAVLDELVAATRGGFQGNGTGRFFGWVVGGTLPAAMGADWLTSAWDQVSALHATSPAAAVVEEVTGRWLKEALGLPASASFALVTGTQMGHVTCLAAARHALLERRGWDVERRGLHGAPRLRILTGSETHGSVERAARLLGLGLDAFERLDVDAASRLVPDALARALERHADEPLIVVLQAGDLNTGAFDPFEELVPLAHERGAWVHVDGAFGLWAGASPELSALTAGVERADSWTTDGHKCLNVPYDSGYAFVAHPDAHRASMTLRASYFLLEEGARDPLDWTPEWSRRARGFATWAALRQLGRSGVAELVEGLCRRARELVAAIGALPGAEVLSPPVLNQGLVRFPSPAPGATEADHDAWTELVLTRVREDGEAFFGGTAWQGRRCMRISVSGWRTDASDVRRAAEAVRRALGEVGRES